MVVCKDLEHIQNFDGSVLTIGSLDGMHLGHIEIISNLRDMSLFNNLPSVVITFDPHPKTVIQSSKQSMVHLIDTNKKMELLEKHEVDYVWIIPFDKEFSHLSASNFLKKYISKYFHPLDIIIGYDHHFGFNREGDEDFLEENKKEYGYNLHVKEPILYLVVEPVSVSKSLALSTST